MHRFDQGSRRADRVVPHRNKIATRHECAACPPDHDGTNFRRNAKLLAYFEKSVGGLGIERVQNFRTVKPETRDVVSLFEFERFGHRHFSLR